MPRWLTKMTLAEKRAQKSEYDKKRRILKREELAAYQVEYRKTAGYREKQNEANKRYRERNKEKISEYGHEYRSRKNVIVRRKEWMHEDYLKNKDYKLNYGKKYYIENKEYVSKRSKAYNQRPEVKLRTDEIVSKNRNRINVASRKYRRKNIGKVRDWGAKRRAAFLKRIPSWANLDKIKEIYNNCPENMAVDHIIPLQGEFVSGLHIETNLQYLTKIENSKKSNRFEPRNMAAIEIENINKTMTLKEGVK